MKANAEKIEKNTVLMEIEVETEQFSKAMDQAYRKLVKNVNVPGFRRGKVPRSILERHIGKQALVDEAVEIVIPEAYFKAVGDTGIEPVAQPELELVQVEEGKPVVFKAKVVVKPEVELGQYIGLEVQSKDVKIEDEDVQKELERLQQRHAKLITIEEGQVQNGDMINLDFDGKVDGEEFEGGKGTDRAIEIGAKMFFPGLEDKLIGMANGETKDIEITFPEDYGREDVKGKKAVFTCTVKEIKRKELALLDDEFAKDISEFDTLEELRTDLRNKLEQVARERIESEKRNLLVNKTTENAQVDIPEEMINTRVEEMIQETEQGLQSQGIPLDAYLNYLNTSIDEMKNRYRAEAERRIKTSLVMEAVAKAENLEPGEEEIQAELEKMSREFNQDVDVVRKVMENQGRLSALTQQLKINKAIDFLVEKARIVSELEVPEEENKVENNAKEDNDNDA